MNLLKGKTVVITGAAGSIGSLVVREVLKREPEQVRAYDTNETGLWELKQICKHADLRTIIGDVRDEKALRSAFNRADYIVHCAAYKHVAMCEYNVRETWRTNIEGSQNVVDMALLCGVGHCTLLSTDKATAPFTTMGVSKLMAERIFVDTQKWVAPSRCRLNAIRLPNVIGTRGGLSEIIKAKLKQDKITLDLTDMNMTRLWTTKWRAVEAIMRTVEAMPTGVFSLTNWDFVEVGLLDLIKRIGEKTGKSIDVRVVGCSAREKLDELMQSRDEMLGDVKPLPAINAVKMSVDNLMEEFV